jgi:hypothetical protein
LFRAGSILVVVLGHWLMAAPQLTEDGLQVGRLIADVEWIQVATWVLQVMPVFFFVGGYANAAAWRSARRSGVPYSSWLRSRLRRLVLPTIPVLGVWAVLGVVAGRLQVDPEMVGLASQAALVPTWFLAIYVLIVSTVPLTLAWWERAGWWAPAGTALAAVVVDAVSLAGGVETLGYVNYLFVWNTVHMLGYAWIDRRIGGTRARLAVAAGGLAAVAALVVLGPYPVPMVGVDGAKLTNSLPPKITLIALGVFQFGLALVAEPRLRRWLERPRAWATVVAVNGSIMSLYLWHLTVMVLVIGLAMQGGGVGLGIAVDSGVWWATRPLWLLLLAVVTLPVLMVVSRFERPADDTRPAPPAWRPLLTVVGACAGLGILAKNGIVTASGLNLAALLLPIAAVTAGGITGGGRVAEVDPDQAMAA